ncbi:hypothetical protein BCR32DRAFT_240379 [Anaeromyces robustus]|uniref:Proteinase inhibitor I42 chagasin domain-containing protein n=1 Tax=Anaeromyces robustus TaxID=1754192 RepID=A0A1Y1XNC4_9FUNG|nr:hypothetical protein BCR32DRAFT_240379 [Anaeromyces robustus]|eukprot:ORX87249.1 hypothetical protein BCR32DRAFT_240379 [Anaeromyces robustus]
MAPLAKDQCIEIPQKGGKFELDVSSNSSFCVKLEGNPTTGFSWSLNNENDLVSSGIEKISQEYVSKKHPKGMVGVGGNYIFKFKVNDTCGKELPNLQFIYKRSWENKNGITAIVKLNSIEKCNNDDNDDNEATVEISQNGGNFNLDIKDNSSFTVKIAGNPTTGYSWFLANAEELKSSNVIIPTNLDENNVSQDYISDPHEEGMVGYGGTFVYKFNVKDACSERKGYQVLNFGYKRPWETNVIAKAEVVINITDCINNNNNNVVTYNDLPNIDISEEGGKFNLDINDYGSFVVKIAGNPTTGYSWYLENAEEIKSSDVINPTNLDERNGSYLYISDPNEKDLDGVGGTFVFKFESKNACGKELPKLNFGYKRPWETTGSVATAEITLNVNGCNNNVVVDDQEPTISINQKGGNFNLDVNDNASFSVKIAGNPTTGYSWYLENAEEIKSSDVILPINLDEYNGSKDYVSDPHEEGMVGYGGTFVYKFNVKNACGKELPKLNFGYKRPWETTGPIATAEITLNVNGCNNNVVIDDQEPTISINQKGGNFNLDVNDNASFSVKIAGNPTTGYSWYLENAEELKSSDVILPINLDEYNGSKDYVSDPHEEGMVGYGGTFVYKFNVKNACGKELPKLNFGYKRPWETTGPIATAEITLNINGCEQKKEQKGVDKEIVLSRGATEGAISLSNDMTFSIKINGNPTTGYSWYLNNEEELLDNDITPLNLTPEKSGEYTSTAPKGLVGGGGIFEFKFKIKEVTDTLPTIKFIYRRSWIPVSDSDRILEVKIKPE